MARRPTATKTPGFAAIANALRRLPDQAATWTRAAHREAWKEYQTRDGEPGLRARFAQTAQKLGSVRPGHFMQAGLGMYQWSARRRMIPRRDYRSRGHLSPRNQRPAFVASGAMRDELMRRRVRPRRAGNEIRTKITLFHRSQNLWGPMHGITRIDYQRVQISYMTTVYTGPGGSTDRADPQKVWVTRTVLQAIAQTSPRTYAQEWSLQRREVAWFITAAERLLRQRVARAVFDKRGNIRSTYRSRLAPMEAAA